MKIFLILMLHMKKITRILHHHVKLTQLNKMIKYFINIIVHMMFSHIYLIRNVNRLILSSKKLLLTNFI